MSNSIDNTNNNIKISSLEPTGFIDNIHSSIERLNPLTPSLRSLSSSGISTSGISSSGLSTRGLDSVKTTDNYSSNKGFLSKLLELFKKKYFKILILILILAFLGLNIFKYLANATDKTTDFLKPTIKKFLAYIGYGVGETSKNIINTSAKGANTGINLVADTTTDVINVGEKVLGVKDVNKNLNTAISKPRKKRISSSIPKPDNSTSTTQMSKSKTGFCYIGEDRGIRSCVKVQDSNLCMSGEIFPTHDICVNPTLRE